MKKKLEVNKTQIRLFEKINTIDTVIKKQREKPQMIKIRNRRSELTINSMGIERIERDYYEKL